MRLDRETTEYVFWGVTGDVPEGDVQVAILPPDQRPSEGDYFTAQKVNSNHNLWGAAQKANPDFDWYTARLVGPWNNDVVLTQGVYQVWLRFTDLTERPVRRPGGLEIL